MIFPDPMIHRTTEYPIEELFLKRWSPRAMSAESISHKDLMSLFEAARWAPSTYNEQEWRFLYATRDSEDWHLFLELLVESNRVWCEKAAALVVVLSHKIFAANGKPNPVHTFDVGAAFQNLSLQGTAMGLVVHGMAGFARDQARERLAIPEDYAVEAMIAIGQPGDPLTLPDKLLKREKPSSRKPLNQIVCAGKFRFGED